MCPAICPLSVVAVLSPQPAVTNQPCGQRLTARGGTMACVPMRCFCGTNVVGFTQIFAHSPYPLQSSVFSRSFGMK